MKSIVDIEHDGMILRTYLKNQLSLSRALVSCLKRQQGIKVNGENVTVRYILKLGDVVEVEVEDKQGSENIMPFDIPLNVVYEDSEIIVIDKPPFMPVHPSHGHRCDTLANALRYRYKDCEFVMRAINRLDRNTSGLVLVAKNRFAASFLSDQMKKRAIGKKYIALVEGHAPSHFSVEAYMKRKNESVIERTVCSSFDQGAEYSFTTGRTLEYFLNYNNSEFGIFPEASMVELVPHTGRTHQLRVHLSYMGFPILGDELYGKSGERHALHCNFLEFIHPITREKMSFESKPKFLCN